MASRKSTKPYKGHLVPGVPVYFTPRAPTGEALLPLGARVYGVEGDFIKAVVPAASGIPDATPVGPPQTLRATSGEEFRGDFVATSLGFLPWVRQASRLESVDITLKKRDNLPLPLRLDLPPAEAEPYPRRRV